MLKFASTCGLRVARHVPRLAAAVATMLVCSIGSHAQQPQQARIVVTGEGSVSVAPNYAQIRSGLTTRAKTVKEGVGTNSKLMLAIVAALNDIGIAEQDIQTARFSIQPIYAPQESHTATEPKLSGYSVSNQVTVTIREIGKVGDVLDRVVAAGATNVGDIWFLVSDASKVLDQAREAAIAEARRNAEVCAKAAGVQLGRAEWITKDTGSGPPVPMIGTRPSPAGAAVIIAAGQKPTSLAGLAADIGLAGFPLGIEGRKGQVEIMLGRFAGVDGAARQPWCIIHAGLFPVWPLRYLAKGQARSAAARRDPGSHAAQARVHRHRKCVR